MRIDILKKRIGISERTRVLKLEYNFTYKNGNTYKYNKMPHVEHSIIV